MSIRKMLGGGATAVLLLGGAPALGGEYEFTTVLNSARDGLVPTRCAAVNSAGTVVVQVRDPVLGVSMLITKRSAHDAPVVIADTRPAADFPTYCDNGITLIPSDPTINELGEVAFQGNLRRLTSRSDCNVSPQTSRRQGVFLGSGGPLTTVAHTINPPGGNFIAEFLVADQAVNDFGRVAIVLERDGTFDQGLYLASKQGTFSERFLVSGGRFGGISSRVALNDFDQIAFRGTQRNPLPRISGIFLSNPDGTFRTIADNTGEVTSFDAPSLNNSGTVAFLGSKFVDEVQVLGVYTSNGGAVTTVVDNTGPFSSFREPSINELGQIAFTADLDEVGPDGFPIQGVFTGSDPKQDVVLKAGDKYDGAQVTSVVSCNEALNNGGEIVMTVQSLNPETFEVLSFIVKATPKR